MKNRLVKWIGVNQPGTPAGAEVVAAGSKTGRFMTGRSLAQAAETGGAGEFKTPGRLVAWLHAPFIP